MPALTTPRIFATMITCRKIIPRYNRRTALKHHRVVCRVNKLSGQLPH